MLDRDNARTRTQLIDYVCVLLDAMPCVSSDLSRLFHKFLNGFMKGGQRAMTAKSVIGSAMRGEKRGGATRKVHARLALFPAERKKAHGIHRRREREEEGGSREGLSQGHYFSHVLAQCQLTSAIRGSLRNTGTTNILHSYT